MVELCVKNYIAFAAGVERRTVASVGGGTMQRRRQEGGDGYWTTESNPEATKMPKPKPCKKLFVNGLPASMTEDSLFKHFSYYGTVTRSGHKLIFFILSFVK